MQQRALGDSKLKSLVTGAMVCTLSLFFLVCAPVMADESEVNPLSFKLGSWVCNSPDNYEQVVAEEARGEASPFSIQKKFKDSCLYMDDDNLEDMLAPFVTVLSEEADKTKVSFFVEFYKRVEFLHRKIQHVRFVGWTASDNVTRLHN